MVVKRQVEKHSPLWIAYGGPEAEVVNLVENASSSLLGVLSNV
jgi:hypothetical protein